MNRSYSFVAVAITLALALTPAILGQTLVDAEHIPDKSRLFSVPPAPPQLRCEITPIHPSLTFDFRFLTGYKIDFPPNQFARNAHLLTVDTRVTPLRGEVVYLTSIGRLAEVPRTNLSGEIEGRFAVGEGTYKVEVLLKDDLHRGCRTAWQIQAQPIGSERHLKLPILPGHVDDDSGKRLRSSSAPPRPIVARITILLHATTLSPNPGKLQPYDIETLQDSLISLIDHLPAKSVRLIAFNLEQQRILLRNDQFDIGQLSDLGAVLNQLELGRIDYRILRTPEKAVDLLVSLLQAEADDSKPADALIVFGPRTRVHFDAAALKSAKTTARSPVMYLQFQPRYPVRIHQTSRGSNAISAAESRVGFPPSSELSAVRNPFPEEFADSEDVIERLIAHLKGDIFPLRSPHDLADAIPRISARIGRTGMPPLTPAEAEVTLTSTNEPEKARKDESAVPEKHSYSDLDPVDLLMRVRDRVLGGAARIPNHTCVESIRRDRYNAAGSHPPISCDALLARRKGASFASLLDLTSTDRLRLDVAFTGNREIYSWAGADSFTEEEIDALVPEGPIGTGPFASLLLSVFAGGNNQFIFEGDTTDNGRTLFEYSYQVPQELSHYRVKTHGPRKDWFITAYSGTLLVNPADAELVRLKVQTAELPTQTSSCEVDTTVEYGAIELAGGDYLLPTSARQRFIGRDSFEAENTISFSGCREYKAESVVRFGEGNPNPKQQEQKPNTPSGLAAVPRGLSIAIELSTEIDSRVAAAGDRIEGRLTAAIRDHKLNTIVAEGARVIGRLMRVQTTRSPSPQLTIVLRWESMDFGGVETPCSLAPNRQHEVVSAGATHRLRRRGIEFELPLAGEERYAVYHFPADTVIVPPGLRSDWIILAK